MAEDTRAQISIPLREISISDDHPLRRLQWPAAALGLGFFILSVLLGAEDTRRFFFSYLVAYLFFLSLALGGLGFVLIQFATRAGWSVAVRRLAEHVMGTLPWLSLLFLPLVFGFSELYPWFDSGKTARDLVLQEKTPYLNPGFFYLRTLVYLLGWSLLSWWFWQQSVRQDRGDAVSFTRRLQRASAPAIVWFAVTLTFFSFDWIMSLDPHWYSTIFGVYFFAGCIVAFLALLIALILILQGFRLLSNIISTEHFHDLGKLLFGFVVFWAYIAFSQFMLIWYANIPEETIWYAHRAEHGWEILTIALGLGHFVLPFFFLLSRTTKRKRTALLAAALWLLFMHYLDLYWLVMPNLQSHGLHPHWLDLTTFLALAGLHLAGLIWLMNRPALIPVKDPRLAESLSFENI
jgi:hypothetical protein